LGLEISDEEGEMLVRLAREAIERYLESSVKIDPPRGIDGKFYEKSGVFVTLQSQTPYGRELRGCIGYPTPDRPLIEALIDSAISSAVHDPRFTPVKRDEFDSLVVEVSVLTPPELISVSSPKEYPRHVRVGVDGLIVKWRFGSGLLLPQVPLEFGWDAEEFLSHTCMKAGATPDCWLTRDVEIYRFQSIIFEEESPRGRVVRRTLNQGS